MLADLMKAMPDFGQDVEVELRRVIMAVADTRNPGEVTIKIKFAPKSGGERVDVTPIVNGKVPKHDPVTGVFFASPDGELSVRDPRQVDLDDILKKKD